MTSKKFKHFFIQIEVDRGGKDSDTIELKLEMHYTPWLTEITIKLQ